MIAVKAQHDMRRSELIANMYIGNIFTVLKTKLNNTPTTYLGARDKLLRDIASCVKYHTTLRTSSPPDICALFAELRDYARTLQWPHPPNTKEILMGKVKTQGMLEFFVDGMKLVTRVLEEHKQNSKGKGKDASLDVKDVITMVGGVDVDVERMLKRSHGVPEGESLEGVKVNDRQVGTFMMAMAERKGLKKGDKKGGSKGKTSKK